MNRFLLAPLGAVVACASPHVAAPPLHRVLLPYPTLASAGAKTCRTDEPVELGPHGEGNAVLAFDASGGIVAWKPSRTSLALQPVAFDGVKSGRAQSVDVPEGVLPDAIRPIGDRFLVLVHDRERSWSLVIDRSGGVEKPLAPARARDVEEPAHRSDAVAFTVINAIEPVPPSGGTIYEPAGRPIFERTLDGRRVGDPLALEWQGNPIAHGFHVESYVVWTGTHFLYPFWTSTTPIGDKYVELLLPIDCHP